MFLDSEPAVESRLKGADTFSFQCRPDLACFNSCCRGKHLPLSPYDVLRLKRALRLHSDEFLSRYAVYRMDPASGFPIVSLKMSENREQICPFVTGEGCSVYPDRPTVCRLFPLGRSSRRADGVSLPDAVFYVLDAPGCLGIKEEKLWHVKEWEANQGLGPFLDMDDKMLGIFFHPRRKPGRVLTDRQLQMIFVAAYNLDVFREFVFKSDFLKRYPTDLQTRKRIQRDDESLLQLGLDYLEKSLFD